MLREPKLIRYPFGNYWWQEINPHEYEITRAAGQVGIGRLVLIPAHGRDKGRWVLPDHNMDAADSKEAVMLLELAAHDVQALPLAPVAPPVSDPPAPVETETLGIRETAARMGVSAGTLSGWLLQGKIPGAYKAPNPTKPGELVWRVPADAAPLPRAHGGRAAQVAPTVADAAPPAPAPIEKAPAAPLPDPEPPSPRRVKAPAESHNHDDLYQQIGRLLGRIEALERDVKYLAHSRQAHPDAAPPSLWHRLTGVSNGRQEGGT
jgi:hypothetical protein